MTTMTELDDETRNNGKHCTVTARYEWFRPNFSWSPKSLRGIIAVNCTISANLSFYSVVYYYCPQADTLHVDNMHGSVTISKRTGAEMELHCVSLYSML